MAAGAPVDPPLRVVIAEDEELIRKGLEREIPWASLGLAVGGLAANGPEAVELCRAVRADILITDIRMPLLDGLAVIERVRAGSPGTECLIISGYHDFSYAQKAISLGVRHYFLKPLELDQIEAKLREVAGRIREERRASDDRRLLDSLLSTVLPFVRRQFFLELLYGPHGDPEVARQLAGLGVVRPDASCAVVLIEAGPGPGEATERGLAARLRGTHYAGDDIYLLRRAGEDAQLAAVLAGTDPRQLALQRDGYLAELRGMQGVRAAAGGIRQGLDRLHESLAEARRDMLLQGLLGGEREGGAAEAHAAGQGRAVPDALREVEQAAGDGDQASLERSLARLEAALPGPAAAESARTAAIVALFDALDRLGSRHGIRVEEALRRTGEEAGGARGGAAALQDVLAALAGAAREAAAASSTRRDLPARHLIDKARRYIDSRFSSWDITLEDVAEHVELNPSYFSTLFKTVTQVNYIDYLTALRMEKARELLEGSDMKISAVARRVGFQSPGYFGYLFKKHFGVTPSQFKAGPGAADVPRAE